MCTHTGWKVKNRYLILCIESPFAFKLNAVLTAVQICVGTCTYVYVGVPLYMHMCMYMYARTHIFTQFSQTVRLLAKQKCVCMRYVYLCVCALRGSKPGHWTEKLSRKVAVTW